MASDWELLSGLINSSSEAALATLEDGWPRPPAGASLSKPQAAACQSWPYASATGYIVENERLTVAVFLSRLARHTKNILKNPAVSLLVMESKAKAPVHEKMRATLRGQAFPVQEKEVFGRLKLAYLEKFPKAGIFFTLPDFAFYRIEPQEIHWIAGFGKACTFVFKDGKWRE